MTKITSGKKIPLKVKIGYGVAEGSNSLIFTLFTAFGMFFFTDVVNLSPAFAGFVLGIGTLWDACVIQMGKAGSLVYFYQLMGDRTGYWCSIPDLAA